MDPAKKESILGDIRIANKLIEMRQPTLGLQVLSIAVARMKASR